jgi:hypothetical protein
LYATASSIEITAMYTQLGTPAMLPDGPTSPG